MSILLLFTGFIIAFAILFYCEYKIRLYKAEPKNKVHFYVARDRNGELWLYIGKPERCENVFCSPFGSTFNLPCLIFKCLGLNKNDYANLKWEDEPVEVFLNMEDIEYAKR